MIPVELFGGDARLFTVPFDNKLCHVGCQANVVVSARIWTAVERHKSRPVMFAGDSDISIWERRRRPVAAIVAAEESAERGEI